MTNEDRIKANDLKRDIDIFKDFLSRIESRGVSLSADGKWITGIMPNSINKMITMVVTAEIMDQLKSIELEMGAL